MGWDIAQQVLLNHCMQTFLKTVYLILDCSMHQKLKISVYLKKMSHYMNYHTVHISTNNFFPALNSFRSKKSVY